MQRVARAAPGTPSEVELAADAVTGELKGYAFLRLEPTSDSLLPRALSALNGLSWQGRRIRVEPAQPPLALTSTRAAPSSLTAPSTSSVATVSAPILASKWLRVRRRRGERCLKVPVLPVTVSAKQPMVAAAAAGASVDALAMPAAKAISAAVTLSLDDLWGGGVSASAVEGSEPKPAAGFEANEAAECRKQSVSAAAALNGTIKTRARSSAPHRGGGVRHVFEVGDGDAGVSPESLHWGDSQHASKRLAWQSVADAATDAARALDADRAAAAPPCGIVDPFQLKAALPPSVPRNSVLVQKQNEPKIATDAVDRVPASSASKLGGAPPSPSLVPRLLGRQLGSASPLHAVLATRRRGSEQSKALFLLQELVGDGSSSGSDSGVRDGAAPCAQGRAGKPSVLQSSRRALAPSSDCVVSFGDDDDGIGTRGSCIAGEVLVASASASSGHLGSSPTATAAADPEVVPSEDVADSVAVGQSPSEENGSEASQSMVREESADEFVFNAPGLFQGQVMKAEGGGLAEGGGRRSEMAQSRKLPPPVPALSLPASTAGPECKEASYAPSPQPLQLSSEFVTVNAPWRALVYGAASTAPRPAGAAAGAMNEAYTGVRFAFKSTGFKIGEAALQPEPAPASAKAAEARAPAASSSSSGAFSFGFFPAPIATSDSYAATASPGQGAALPATSKRPRAAPLIADAVATLEEQGKRIRLSLPDSAYAEMASRTKIVGSEPTRRGAPAISSGGAVGGCGGGPVAPPEASRDSAAASAQAAGAEAVASLLLAAQRFAGGAAVDSASGTTAMPVDVGGSVGRLPAHHARWLKADFRLKAKHSAKDRAAAAAAANHGRGRGALRGAGLRGAYGGGVRRGGNQARK